VEADRVSGSRQLTSQAGEEVKVPYTLRRRSLAGAIADHSAA
jgi:hypothetical protein